MGVQLKIGNLVDLTIGSVAAEKMGRAGQLGIEDWEESHGVNPPFDLSQPAKAYRNVSWVYACVRAIQSAVQRPDLVTYRQRGGQSKPSEGDAVTALFYDVNPHMSATDLWEWTAGSLELSGNSYWEIERNGRGIPVALYPLRPDCVKIVPDKADFIKGYIYSVNGREIALGKDDVFHMRYWNPESDYYGLGSYQAASRVVTIDTWAQKFNETFFKNDATPGGALETDEDLDEEAAKALRLRWENLHRGRNRAHRIAILSSGLKYKPTSASIKDMQFPQLREMNREEICAMFGVPPGVVGIMKFTNYTNLKEQQQIFWKNKIVPLLEKIAEALNQGFIPYFKDPSLYVEFNLSQIEALREDQTEKSRREDMQIRNGSRTINELRNADGLPPVPWGDEPPQSQSPMQMLSLEAETLNTKALPPPLDFKATGREHYSIDRHQSLIHKPAKSFLDDMSAAMLKYLKSDNRMRRLRAYAEHTDPGDGEKRDRRRDAEIVQGLFAEFDFLTEQAPRLEKDFEKPYQQIYEKGARFGARKLRRMSGKALPYRTSRKNGDTMGHHVPTFSKGFELVDENILKWLAERRAFWLARGMSDAYGQLELIIAQEFFDKYRQYSDTELVGGITDLFELDSSWRALRIARTETHHVGQNAQREMFKRSLVRFLEWAHSGNPNGRENHMALDGVTINIENGERFQVGSYTCEGPGDSSLGPEESINCDCDTLPAVAGDEGYTLPDDLWDGS